MDSQALALFSWQRVTLGLALELADVSAYVLIVALIFGLVNTFIRPVVKLFSFGITLVTLGLFTFVINALMLWLTSKISEHFAVQFHVKNFLSALLGSLVITVVSLMVGCVGLGAAGLTLLSARRVSYARLRW